MKGKFFLFSMVFFFLFSLSINASAEETSPYIIINKSKNQLAYFVGDELVKVFPVATGKTKSLTPEGTFSIIVKIKYPYYTAGKIAGGDPKNPLGDRWLGLSVPGTGGSKYGIHGNANPASIGTYASAGCIRMHESDVAWLYDQIPKGTKVHIVSSKRNFVQLAAQYGHQVTSVVSGQPTSQPKKPKVDPITPLTFKLNVDDKGVEVPKEATGILEKGKEFLPLKVISEKLGYEYQYDSKTKSITLRKNKLEVQLNLNKKEMVKYGEKIVLDNQPKRYKDTIYVTPNTIVKIVENDSKWDSKKVTLTLQTNPFYPYIKKAILNLDQYITAIHFFF